MIVEEGKKIENLYIAVEGSLAKLKGSQSIVQKEEIYPTLISMSNKYVKTLVNEPNSGSGKETISTIRKKSMTITKLHAFPTQLFKPYEGRKLIDVSEIEKTEHCGFYDKSVGQTYLDTVVSMSEILLLKIPLSKFLICLDQISQAKVKELEDEIRKLPCFDLPIFQQEKQKFTSLVLAMNLKKKKRGDFIYKQNDKSTSLYVLKKGDVKLSKETNLFVENPNNLYTNRVKLLIEEKEDSKKNSPQKETERKQEEALLPYADLRQLYNYQPKTKAIEIGILSAFCLFGEEENFEKKNRETDAVCSSLEVLYYEISLKKVEEIIGLKHMPAFLEELKRSSKNKVLYRQSQYANTIHFENKSNLDYFYYEGEEEKKGDKRFRITKFNKLITPEKRKAESSKVPSKFPTPAFFTSFNFNKMNDQNPEQNRRIIIDNYDDVIEVKPTKN